MATKTKSNTAWTQEDDGILLKCVSQSPTLNDAFEAASTIVGRSPGGCAQRYYSHLKPKKEKLKNPPIPATEEQIKENLEKASPEVREQSSLFAWNVVKRMSLFLNDEQKLALIESWV